jgi:hypothetical protein
LLRIRDREGKLKFVLRDEDEEPVDFDKLVLEDERSEEEEEQDNDD